MLEDPACEVAPPLWGFSFAPANGNAAFVWAAESATAIFHACAAAGRRRHGSLRKKLAAGV